jgi:hypothetical protein
MHFRKQTRLLAPLTAWHQRKSLTVRGSLQSSVKMRRSVTPCILQLLF